MDVDDDREGALGIPRSVDVHGMKIPGPVGDSVRLDHILGDGSGSAVSELRLEPGAFLQKRLLDETHANLPHALEGIRRP